MPYHIHDSDGRITLILKKSEKAARMAWDRMQKENQRDFGMRPRAIVKIVEVGK